MDMVRATLAIAGTAFLAAGAVALASRAPAELRAAKPADDAFDPSNGTEFDEDLVARHDAYRRAGYAAVAASLLLEVIVLVVLARGPIARLADRISLPGGWLARAVVVAAAVAVVMWLASLPLAYVRGYVVEHAWGLSTQDAAGWVSDRLRVLAVHVVIAAVSAVAFFGIVRWQPRSWWIAGWLGFTALTALLVFLYPVAIAPLFNRFTPLQDAALEQRVRQLASDAGVSVDEVLVADASKRSTVENAYVAGLGSSKQLVLFDTLVKADDADATAYVVAHELGHQVHDHVPKNVAIASVGLLAGFGALAWLSSLPGVWSWAGAEGVTDVRALPLLLLFATIAGFVLLPAQNGISRAFERQADQVALQLTNDPQTAVRVYRRLAISNLADLRPSPVAVWALYSHPPIEERIRAALTHASRSS